MAPPNKREASPEQNEEVCKRLKEDLKDVKQAEPVESKIKAEVEDDKHNNNNNNNTSVDDKSNGKAKSDESKNEELSADKKQDDEKAQSNGEKVEEIKAEEKEKPTPNKDDTNGDKTSGEQKVKTSSESETKLEQNDSQDTEDAKIGTLLMCGGANWDMTGRKELPKTAKKPVETNHAARNLWGPHKVTSNGEPLRVKGIFSGCNACHSVIITHEGVTMTFGRNDKGQLGLGDTETRVTPVVVDGLKGIDVVAAACGRAHTLFLTSDGVVYSCGDNKMGQCGTNQQSVQQITTPARVAFKENKRIVKMACGAEFSMIVDEDGRLYSFGHPEHGQLGHNSEAKYFTSGNKYAFHCEYAPRRVVTFIEKSREGHISPVEDVQIVDVACGTNHTLAVDKRHRCFSWGFAGYHRLGHSETKNELVPRSIKVFDAPPNSGRGASRVFAGASHSMALDVNGLLYFWGQNKSSGEATMTARTVQDLYGWKIRAVSCANRSIFVIADDACISWGPSPTYGELGYGEGKSKSSTVPQEVKTLDGVHVNDVACGFGHTLLICRDRSTEDKASLDKFKDWP